MKAYVLITGATSGIGYELAKLFSRKGHNLIIVGRKQDKLNSIEYELKEKFSVDIKSIQCDLSKYEDLDKLCNSLEAVNIDILINNAGFNVYGEFNTTEYIDELDMINVNIVALTKLTKVVGKKMISRGMGKIMNVGSTGSFVPGPYNAVYCATKAYVLSFSEALSEEFKNTGVTITTLCPGATETNFAKRANMNNISLFKKNVMKASVAAEVGYRALMKGKIKEIVGISNKISVYAAKFMPVKNVLNIVSKMMK